jgi:hypothetical protein
VCTSQDFQECGVLCSAVAALPRGGRPPHTPKWDLTHKVKVKVKVTLRLAVYRQLFRRDARPLETHEERLFPSEPFVDNPYATSSLARKCVCFLII